MHVETRPLTSTSTQVTHTNIVPHEFGDYALPAEKWAHYPEKGQQRVQRLTNHLNQYLSWKRCARAVADAELGNGGPYDAVLRMRDNGLVLRPFHLRRMLAMQVFESATRFGRPKPQAVTHEHVRVLPVLVKMCSGWGGLNDKVGRGEGCCGERNRGGLCFGVGGDYVKHEV